MVALWLAVAASSAQNPVLRDTLAADAALARARLDALEPAQALTLAKQLVAEFDHMDFRYDVRLVEPLTILGEAQAALGNEDEALDSFEQARHVLRLHVGLNSAEQLDLVYLEADLFAKRGEFAKANGREEYAFHIAQLAFTPDSIEDVNATMRLANWYRDSLRFLWARVLYAKAMQAIPAGEVERGLIRIEALREFARTFWTQQSARRRTERFAEVRPRPIGVVEPSILASQLATRPEGGRYGQASAALIQAVAETRSHPDSTAADEIEVTLQLANWRWATGNRRQALELYLTAWQIGETRDPSALGSLRRPQLLRIADPGYPHTPTDAEVGGRQPGHISFAFDVSARGRVLNLVKTEAEPGDLPLFKYYKATREALFRPALDDGKPVATADVRHTHRFWYSPPTSNRR